MGWGSRLRAGLEEYTGLTLMGTDERASLQEQISGWGDFADEAGEFATMVSNYWPGGRPQELMALQRRILAEQSRTALTHDPLAGAEAGLRANFAFGKGIPMPQAKDPDVQKIIERAWDDPVNQEKLTSYEAQRYRSNQMITDAQLMPVAYTDNGRVRLGFLDPDLVVNVVTDPEDDELPLWYATRKRQLNWSFTTHTYMAPQSEMQGGQIKVWYFEHWRNVEDQRRAAAKYDGVNPPPEPNAGDKAPGRVGHFRINRIGRTQFGVPPWARTLRFYSAMNQFTEARVVMAQAQASIIAKRTRRTGPKDVMKAAGQVINTAGQLAAARFGGGVKPTGAGTEPQAGQAPIPAGSWWMENESDTLQAVNLNSGAAQALSDVQIIRAPIAGASQFGQHYLGDASHINLATASTLELPTLAEITSWQQTFMGLLGWFVDIAIEEAIKAGELGGMIAESDTGDTRSLQELHLAEDAEEMEARLGKDLSYGVEMPFPGRRQIPEVAGLVVNVANSFDPEGTNVPLRRKLLDFLFRHGMQTPNPNDDVDAILPEDAKPEPFPAAAQAEAATAAQMANTTMLTAQMAAAQGQGQGAAPGSEMGTDASQYGERRAAGVREALDPNALDELTRILVEDGNGRFDELLKDPRALLTAGANGNGNAPAA